MTTSRLTSTRTLRRLRTAAADAAYAQHRLFELRTGLVVTDTARRRHDRAQIAELESLLTR